MNLRAGISESGSHWVGGITGEDEDGFEAKWRLKSGPRRSEEREHVCLVGAKEVFMHVYICVLQQAMPDEPADCQKLTASWPDCYKAP